MKASAVVSLAIACVFVFANIAAAALPSLGSFPNGYAWGCQPGNISSSLPFCDSSLTIDERVDDLMSRLTFEELMFFMGPSNNTGLSFCGAKDNGIPRLGIDSFLNLDEANTAANGACLGEDVCQTEFPAPANLAASFNRTLWAAKGAVISTEYRVYSNLNWYRTWYPPYSLIAPSGFGPNMNIIRDPRFGRNPELPTEDPFLSGSYAWSYVQGMQQGEDPRHLKMIVGLKHFTAYSVEDNREGRNFNISTYDLFDTYLAQFRMAFHPDMGNARAVMCSYTSINGVPACANDYLINQVARGLWGRSDIVVLTDCGAIGHMVDNNHYADNDTDAAAKALNGGTDINAGDGYFSPVSVGGNGALAAAIEAGMTDAGRVFQSVRRILTNRFMLGYFDPLEETPYTQYGAEHMNTTAAQQLILEGALQGMVLLKNDNNTLPFSTSGKTVAVIGPHVFSQRNLFEDYKGDETCFDNTYDCVPTIASTFSQMIAARGGTALVAQGVDISSNDTSGIAAAMKAVANSNYVVLCIGIGNDQEHEGDDRDDISLPGFQESFALEVLQTAQGLNIPVAIVLINGGIVTIDKLVPYAPAIIEAFYPAKRGPEALFLHIFGEANAWGRLPVTYYNADFTNKISMYDFNMTSPPGRTYRYYTDTPLFPFGWGLSYTQFSLHCVQKSHISIDCTASNVGSRAGDVVYMMFHSYSPSSPLDHPVPIRSLRDFTRLTIPAGGASSFSFQVSSASLSLTNSHGDTVVYAGAHNLTITDGVNTDSSNSFVFQVPSLHVVEKLPRV